MDLSGFNYIEASLWFLIAAALALTAYRATSSSPYFLNTTVASLAFFLFGVSDILEAHTGAWWRPHSLLLLKGVCIVILVGCLSSYFKTKRDLTHRSRD